MTDLEMIKKCAERMGLRDITTHDNVYVWVYNKAEDNVERYNPLHDDAQAMGLVKKFNLVVLKPGKWQAFPAAIWNLLPNWSVYDGPIGDSADLNRAIVECVAKLP